MLTILRKKHVARWGLIILTTVIIFAFVFWGSTSLLRERSSRPALGTIFGKPIRADDYKSALLAVRNLAVMRHGDKFSEVADYLNLEAQAWERLILLGEARRRRIRVADREVIAEVQKFPFFQEEGSFDQKRYEQLTSYVFGTPARLFEEQVRDNLMISKLYEQVTASVSITDDELLQEYEKENMEMRVSYIAAFPSDFAEGIATDEAQLEAFYNENSVSFKEPLSFKVRYVSAASRELIRQAYERLEKKTTDMQSLAQELSLQFKETEFFGENDPIPGIGWDPRVNKMLSSLKEGELAIPFSDDENTYLIQLAGRREPSIPEFSQIKETVKEYYIQAESVKKARTRIESAHAALAEQIKENPEALDLKRTAKEFGLTHDSTALFSFQSYIEGIGSSNPFWLAARPLEKQQISAIINMPSGFFVITPQEKVPIDEETFEEEKEEFRTQVLALKKQERFSVFLRSLSQTAIK